MRTIGVIPSHYYPDINGKSLHVDFYRTKDTAGYLVNGSGLLRYNFDTTSAYKKIFQILKIDNELSKQFAGRYIRFDTAGHICKLQDPLTFLTNKDSNALNNDYPNCQEEVKAWNKKKPN